MQLSLEYIRELVSGNEGADIEFKVTDERGVVRVTFMRPDLSGHNNGTIDGTINDTM